MEDKRKLLLETLQARAKAAREKAIAEGKVKPALPQNAKMADVFKRLREKANKIEKKEE